MAHFEVDGQEGRFPVGLDAFRDGIHIMEGDVVVSKVQVRCHIFEGWRAILIYVSSAEYPFPWVKVGSIPDWG